MPLSEEMRELYQEVILDHSKRPRNFRTIDNASHHSEGYNPLCGDKIHLYLLLEEDKIADISFEGAGCAISTASSSLMTQLLKGKTPAEAQAFFDAFHDLVTGKGTSRDLGKLEVLSGVQEFPVRVKCATLAWHTLRAALDQKTEAVSTE